MSKTVFEEWFFTLCIIIPIVFIFYYFITIQFYDVLYILIGGFLVFNCFTLVNLLRGMKEDE